MQYTGRRWASTVFGGGGTGEAKKSVSFDNIWSFLSDNRVQKLIASVFAGGIVASSAYHLDKKVGENSNDLKQMDAKIDRLDSKMDAKMDRLDAKMDQQFTTIMMFTAIGRLPNSFIEKIETPPVAEKAPDVSPAPKKKDE